MSCANSIADLRRARYIRISSRIFSQSRLKSRGLELIGQKDRYNLLVYKNPKSYFSAIFVPILIPSGLL